jgi:hypothetical protein
MRREEKIKCERDIETGEMSARRERERGSGSGVYLMVHFSVW